MPMQNVCIKLWHRDSEAKFVSIDMLPYVHISSIIIYTDHFTLHGVSTAVLLLVCGRRELNTINTRISSG